MKSYRKPTLQETLEANATAMRGLCMMGGKPMPRELEAPERVAKKPRAAPVKSDVPTEHEEQKAFVKWYRMQYPRVRIFAVPNAAARSPELASYLRAEGLTKGVPDLIVLAWRLCIEMKRVTGSVISPEQDDWSKYLARIGWRHFYAYGCEDAIRKIQEE